MFGRLSEDEKIKRMVEDKFPDSTLGITINENYYIQRELYREALKKGIEHNRKNEEW
jgi:hypothetical protein